MKQGIALLALGLAALAGCAREVEAPSVADYEQERAALAERAKGGGSAPDATQAAGGAQSSDVARSEATYRYDPTGKRDPFRSYVLEKKHEKAKRGPLEQFDLGQLEVTAVIWGAEKPRALVLDPSGRGYIVATGTRIGKNSGQVVSIDDSMVVIRETYVDHRGEPTTKNVEMRIRHSQGG